MVADRIGWTIPEAATLPSRHGNCILWDAALRHFGDFHMVAPAAKWLHRVGAEVF